MGAWAYGLMRICTYTYTNAKWCKTAIQPLDAREPPRWPLAGYWALGPAPSCDTNYEQTVSVCAHSTSCCRARLPAITSAAAILYVLPTAALARATAAALKHSMADGRAIERAR